MDNKKRLMFSLEEDYYYITLKILLILKGFNCDNKPFIDYRKLGLIFEIIKDEKTIRFINRLVQRNFENVNLIENDRILDIACNSKLNTPVIKRILLFLESKRIIELCKGKNTIDILLVKNDEVFNILDNEKFIDDVNRIGLVKDMVPRVRYIKFTTLKKKLFGDNEVIKWED